MVAAPGEPGASTMTAFQIASPAIAAIICTSSVQLCLPPRI
jgi:hypothetical protein